MNTFKNTRLSFAVAFGLLSSFATTSSFAQQVMSYQGIATNSGASVSGTHTVSLAIYANATGGAALWSETHTNVTFTDGVFNVLLGSVTPLTPPLIFDAGSYNGSPRQAPAYFLGVTIPDFNGGAELTPRSQLGATPTAWTSQFADTARTADIAHGLAPNASGVVTSVNTLNGAVTLAGGGSTTVSSNGQTITISSSGGAGGTGIQGVSNTDGTINITNPTGPTATISVNAAKVATNLPALGGDVTGGYSATIVGKIQGVAVSSTAPTSGYVLTYNGSVWAPTAPAAFALPYSQTISSGSTLFALTNSGSGAAISGSATASGIAGVQGSSTSNTGVGILGIASDGGIGVLSNSGVCGTSAASHGVAGLTNSGYGIEGAVYTTGVGIYGTAGSGATTARAGFFEITNVASTANAVEVNNPGTGSAIKAVTTSATSTNPTILAQSSAGGSAVAAIEGEATPTTPTGENAGVYGLNDATNGNGFGVLGRAYGGATGVAGYSTNGNGIIGVTSGSGDAVYGEADGSGIAVEGYSDGTGEAGFFEVKSASSSATALAVSTLGTGSAITAVSAGGSGVAGVRGSTTNASGIGVLGVTSDGGGGFSSNVAVFGTTQGGTGVGGTTETGVGVNGYAAGTGLGVHGSVGAGATTAEAGFFENTASSTSGDVLEAKCLGTGEAGYFHIDNASSSAAAISVSTAGSGSAVSASGSGINSSGATGSFTNSNVSASARALCGFATGSGVAVLGENDAGGTGVWAWAGGTGNALLANYAGSGTSSTTQNNIAIFQNDGTNKARIDNTGKGYFDGGTVNSGADVAEQFDVAGTRSGYEPGDVLVISTKGDREVEKCSEPYSRLVAGVYATKPGVTLTNMNIDVDQSAKVPLGVIGVIPTKVSGENGPIAIGDLLVTSATPGHAMRADLDKLKIGQAIGKALQNFSGSGTGIIEVLVGKY